MSDINHAEYIKTIFCDFDGCIVKHYGSLSQILNSPCVLLPGVKEKFDIWCRCGYKVIITTGRPESARLFTMKQIERLGLYYHALIMGLPRGQRVVINDVKPDSNIPTAACINLERNGGMENVNI